MRRMLAWAALALSLSCFLAAAISSQYPHAMKPPHRLDPGAPRFVTWLEQWVTIGSPCALVIALLSFPRWQALIAIFVLSLATYLMIR
ncbi:MAG: hypothetical protein ACREXY_10515 [Gammaproteobacteria bacterium]